MSLAAPQTLAALVLGAPAEWGQLASEPEAFLAACREEDLSGLIYYGQRHRAEFATWPEQVRAGLAGDVRAARARELLVRRELQRALAALLEVGIEPVLLKGTALAYTVYPEPSLRPRADTDVLVDPSHAGRVREVLTARGYTPTLLCEGELVFRQFELCHEDEFGLAHALDVHWAISTQALFADLLTYRELRARAQPASALGPNAWVPHPVDALLLALIHPAMHHRNEQRLLWAYDIHLLASRLDGAEFEALAARAVDLGIAAIAAAGLVQSIGWFGTAVPAAVLEALRAVPLDRQPSASYLEPSRTWARETLMNVRSVRRWRDRLQLLREIALPNAGYMLRAYGLEGSRWGRVLLPALYLHRGIRGLWRVASGRK
jgi:hypothetical protein